MKKRFLAFVISIVAGGIAGALVVIFLVRPPLMLENESRYDFETTLNTVEQSAINSGWTVPAVHDLQASLAKAGKEVNKVKVFALCNPEYAVQVLGGDDERIYSNLMPCRVSVYTKSDGKTYVSRLNMPRLTKDLSGEAKSAMRGAYRDMESVLSGIILK